jgi:glyoxylase-like metal-dependent hydrolase (beta-lactamase superfamily II)
VIQIEQVGNITKFRLARTVFGRGLYFTAAYMLDGLIIDTGCAYTVRELTEALAGSHLHTIVNTHSHEDHIGANAELHKRFGARILAHPDAAPILTQSQKPHLRPYQHVMWGFPAPCNPDPIPDKVETDRYCFEVVHTPGHSPDHICLFEPDHGYLFTGDAYVGGRDRALRADYNIWLIIDSLKKMAALGPNVLFAGSGSVRNDAPNELAEKIKYLEDLGGQILALKQKGWSNRRIRLSLLGREMSIAWYTLGHFSGSNLVRSFVEDFKVVDRSAPINPVSTNERPAVGERSNPRSCTGNEPRL